MLEQGMKLTAVPRRRVGFKLYTAMNPLGYKLMIHSMSTGANFATAFHGLH